MTTQPDLFSPYANTHTVQRPLLDLAGPIELPTRCPKCRAALIQLDSGYITCPKGHLRLLVDVDGLLELPTNGGK